MKVLQKQTLLVFLLLLILSVPALKSLTIPGLYTSHDGETHTARIAQYYQALTDGQFPPRFAGTFYSGLGSPIFVYIYPIPYAISSVWHFLGANFSDSFKITMALSFIFSGLFTYLWLKELLKSPRGALAGAIFYIFVPYRFSLIYVRASISEMVAYVFVPLALYLFTKLIDSENPKYISLAAISIGLILLSQNLVALLCLPVICTYVLLISFRNNLLKNLFYSSVAIAWGVALSSITYLPVFFERKFVRLDGVLNNAYVSHFVSLDQLIHSPWGYGFDMPGSLNDQMSFQIGLIQIVVLLISIVLLGLSLLKFKFLNRLINTLGKREFLFTLFFLFVFFGSVLLMLDIPLTYKIWDKFRQLAIIDLPWRFLGLTSLSAAFLAAIVVKSIKQGMFLIILIALVIIANRNHARINQQRLLTDDFFLNYTDTATQYSEFAPKWRQTTRVPIYFDSKDKAEYYQGEGSFSVTKANSKFVSLNADVKSEKAFIIIHKFYFPGVQITLDGNKLAANKEYEITDPQNVLLDSEKDLSGLPKIPITKGFHQITMEYKETYLRLFANLVTAFSLVLAVSFSLFYAKRH
ncbi:glycosyltransferase family 39 protein [Candidatus Curtissbacteria bacterium]|nr:glycosyltransferase family 39 protein [Candidatus Curtissbacteria bacterium]